LVRVVNLPRSIPDLTLLPTPIAPVKTPRKSFPGKHLQSGVNDKGASDFIDAQDGRQGFDALGLDKTDGGPIPPQSILVEELDSTEGDGASHPGPAADIGAVEEIVPQFLIRNQVRGLVIVLSQFANRSDRFMGAR